MFNVASKIVATARREYFVHDTHAHTRGFLLSLLFGFSVLCQTLRVDQGGAVKASAVLAQTHLQHLSLSHNGPPPLTRPTVALKTFGIEYISASAIREAFASTQTIARYLVFPANSPVTFEA